MNVIAYFLHTAILDPDHANIEIDNIGEVSIAQGLFPHN